MTREEKDQMELAISLLIKTLPHLDLRISEHNDGYRLQRDILHFIAGYGYPDYLLDRNGF